jgi:hypothetical protein
MHHFEEDISLFILFCFVFLAEMDKNREHKSKTIS